MPAAWRPALGVAVVLLLVALAARPLARRISQPVERLTEAARRLGGGDLAARVPLEAARGAAGRRSRWRHRRRDELDDLTRAFNDMAERVQGLVQSQRELLANVSHELRSPLARIRVALALLPRTAESDARVRDVEIDLAELERLIEDVLTTARLDATGLPPHPEPFDVLPLLHELAARAAHDPLTAGTAVGVQPGPSPTLTADRALVKRALWNLVENAAKYGQPPITLAATAAGADVRLSVTDLGPGIPLAERERVLRPFYRLDPARTPAAPGAPAQGVGLGLTLVQRIAAVHGGRVEIAPAVVEAGGERGCRVVLILPVQPAGSGAA
jgi:signal transduction histidine kinase